MSGRGLGIALAAALLAAWVGCAAGPMVSKSGPVTRQQMLEARVTELRYQIQESRERLGIAPRDGAAFTPSRHPDAGIGKPPGVPPGPMSAAAPGGRCVSVCDLADAICQDADELCKIADELADSESHAECQDAQQSCKIAQERCHSCR